MRFLLLHPSRRSTSIDQLRCFSDIWGYYLGRELPRHVSVDHCEVPGGLNETDRDTWFDQLDVSGYDAVLGLGLRFFSDIPRHITDTLRKKLYPGFLCQLYDGSRLDSDGVDITFTIKNEDHSKKYNFGASAARYVRHRAHNEYVGWAADSDLNVPAQDKTTLRLLIDHTNYGNNPVDRSDDVIAQIRRFYNSGVWKGCWNNVLVRRFDSGQVVTVDLDDQTPVSRYNRDAIPYCEICKEHGQAHVFFVTHPESVGLVVLETAMAGALTVTPVNFIPHDRLCTVRHVEYQDQIEWDSVLNMIDPDKSRNTAIDNSWEQVSKRMRDAVHVRSIIRQGIK